jgi:beta-glucosidase
MPRETPELRFTNYQSRRLLALAAILLAVPLPARADDPPYKNIDLSFEERAADLVSRMTLEEKADQVLMATPENRRLGLPGCNWWSEALHGVGRAGTATIYPESIGLAATWNPPLIHDVASAISDEARAKYDPSGARYRGLMLWCPTVNMARDPRWGRTEETYGEDPFLTARIAVAYIQGLQGDDPKYLKSIATPKHFAAHSQEVGRMSRDVVVSEEILRDYYLPAFHACFTEGNALSVMAAHNAINGIPCAANKWLLTDILRGEWHFEGSVVSDWTGVSQMIRGHGYASDDVEACADAINAGLDVICDPRPLDGAVVEAVQSKKLPVEALDRAVRRNLTLRLRLGILDPPDKVPFNKITAATAIGSKEHLALALRSARESIVLLKNDAAPKGFGFEQLLPLDLRRIDSIAVVGQYPSTRQFGAYSAQSPAGPSPTILEAIRAAAGDRVQVNTADWADPDRAIHIAETSTIAIAVMGLNITIEKEGIDRYSLDLPIDQRQFLEKLVAANPLTIVILEGGSPIGVEWMKANVPAIMDVWYPGEAGGAAVADVLFGRYNPAGRLPMTFHRSVDDLPPMVDYTVTNGRTYMYARKPVSYPFGHGLSYTSFTYGPLSAPEHAASGDTIDIAFPLTNSGPRDGDEVPQLYVRKLRSASPMRPQLQLKAFTRVPLAKSSTQIIHFSLKIKDLALWNSETKKYAVEPGTYELLLGASAADIRQRKQIEIK